MKKRGVTVAGKKSIVMTNYSGKTRSYYSAEAAARWWAKWIVERDFFRDSLLDSTGKKEAKLRRRSLPIFERYFNSPN